MLSMVSHSSHTDACFRPHCFPEIGAGGTPSEAETEASFPGKAAGGDPGAFVPAKNGGEPTAELSLEERLALAREEGHAAGFDAGQKAAAESLAPVIQALQSAVAAMSTTESDIMDQAERAVVELSLGIAAKMIPQTIEAMPEAALAVVNQALEKVLAGTRLTLRVNPEDLEQLQERQQELTLPAIDPARLSWSADPGVGRGGCILETDFGDIDARIEHQLEVIDHLFRRQLAKTDSNEADQGAGR